MDWAENINTKGYQHPLGKNHTALDCYLRKNLRNKSQNFENNQLNGNQKLKTNAVQMNQVLPISNNLF